MSNKKKDEISINVFTAFSGYDSQCMALEKLHETYPNFNYKLVGWSEIDEPAIASHNAVLPEAASLNYGDISKVDWSQVPDFDLFTYSSPCQDWSRSGLQRGGAAGSGTRSSLLWECERTIREKRPKYCLLENVKALYSDSKFKPYLFKWRDMVDAYGYKSWIKVLNAADYDVPQGRERVFMVSIRLDVWEKEFNKQDYLFPAPMKRERKIEDFLVEQDMVPEEYYIKEHKIPKFLNLLNHAGEDFENALDEEQMAAINAIERNNETDNPIGTMSAESGLNGYVPAKDKDNALF